MEKCRGSRSRNANECPCGAKALSEGELMGKKREKGRMKNPNAWVGWV